MRVKIERRFLPTIALIVGTATWANQLCAQNLRNVIDSRRTVVTSPGAENPFGLPGPAYAGHPAEEAAPMRAYIPDGGENEEHAKTLNALRELRHALASTRGEQERQTIVRDMESTLNLYFDRDMEARRAELERLTKRADETQTQLDKRQSMRSELIDLQLRSFQLDADGLGLFSGGRPREIVARLPHAVPPIEGPLVAAYAGPGRGKGEPSELDTARRAVHEARRKLQEAESDEAKGTAMEELRTALGTYFDRDLERRRGDLEKVRKDLVQLQSKLEKRATAKSEIVSLQLKLLVNEAEGLGFFSDGDATATDVLLRFVPTVRKVPGTPVPELQFQTK